RMSTVAGARVGVACEEICRQDAAGIGHRTPSQSSQLLQGAFVRWRSVAGAPDGTAAAATAMNPVARTARQASTEASARKRVMGRICAAQRLLPMASE